ncbi:hypothetical protein Trydic_g2152 [Trypoxylus dichotomus]
MVMSEQGGLAMHQLPLHHRGLVQPSLVMNPHPLNDSCSIDTQNTQTELRYSFIMVRSADLLGGSEVISDDSSLVLLEGPVTALKF